MFRMSKALTFCKCARLWAPEAALRQERGCAVVAGTHPASAAAAPALCHLSCSDPESARPCLHLPSPAGVCAVDAGGGGTAGAGLRGGGGRALAAPRALRRHLRAVRPDGGRGAALQRGPLRGRRARAVRAQRRPLPGGARSPHCQQPSRQSHSTAENKARLCSLYKTSEGSCVKGGQKVTASAVISCASPDAPKVSNGERGMPSAACLGP